MVTIGTSGAGKNCIYNYKVSYVLYSFGPNAKPLAQIPPLKESIKEALDNRILLSLAIAAFFTLVAGMIKDPAFGWIEGLSIYIAIVAIVAITALNDWAKDKQFVRLQEAV